MRQISITYDSTEAWIEVWLQNFIITRGGRPVSRQEMILEALRKQAEDDLRKVLDPDQVRILFYPLSSPVVDLERPLASDSTPPDITRSCGYPSEMTMHEIVGWVASYSKGVTPRCIYSTLKTVGRTRQKQIRLYFSRCGCPVYYHPYDTTREIWTLQNYT